jgi:hypothetical protein
MFKAQRYGNSTAMRDRVIGIAEELSRTKTIADPARERLLETRKSLVSAWMKAAEVLDTQGEVVLAGDVRYFAGHLPTVLTDRQALAAQLIKITEESVRSNGTVPSAAIPKFRGGRVRASRLQPRRANRRINMRSTWSLQ